MNKKLVSNLMVILSMLAGLLVFPLLETTPVQAAWLTGWNYKVPITVTNTGAASLTDYQVRIDLNTTNFLFDQANIDGTDIRFTAADGATLLSYWTENWVTATSGRFWVKIPSLPASGSVTIYLYHGNPLATTSGSDGYSTFAFFDDFEDSIIWTRERGSGSFTASTIRAKRGSRSGYFVYSGTGSTIWLHSQPLTTGFIQEWDLYDDMDMTAFKMVRVTPSGITGVQDGIGVWTGCNASTYCFHTNGYTYTNSNVARTADWHKFAIRMTPTTASFFIEDNLVGQASNSLTSAVYVSVEGIAEGATEYNVDDIRIRKYASPEPGVTIGQGGTASVDLAITKTDSPDPVRVGQTLTYSISIYNYGDLDATNVVLSDTLPSGVTFGSVSTTQGSCTGTTSISCTLGNIASAGSALITLRVSPTVDGPLNNTATVTQSETDPNLANNTSTATTVVGNPVVYVVSGVDTEPFDDHIATPQHRPFNLSNYIPATTTYIGPVMQNSFRSAHLDSYNHPLKWTWYVEMDNYINNGVYADGTPMDYLTLYNTFVSNYGTELQAHGDELAYHHHFWAWNGIAWAQAGYEQQALSGPYDEHNNPLDRMILDAGFFPTDFRSGWLNTSNELQGWIEKWMLADFSANWWSSFTPYHPLPSNYTQADTTGSVDHWVARCGDGGPNTTNINAAFAQAASTGKPVIYCWYGHDRENLSGYANTLQAALDTAETATGIPFIYATSKEAMQAVIGTTDHTPPVLQITKGTGDTFNITSAEPVWNGAPYVTARYLTPSGLRYLHNPASLTGTNPWTVEFPDQQTWTTTIPPQKYTPTGVTASSEKPGYPATYAIDGNETTYWDSETLPQWIRVDLGDVQPVRRLTVHFYDVDARTYTYSVDASEDGSTWTEIVASTTVHGLATHDFAEAVDLRYVRVNVTAQSINNFAHIYEISLYPTTESTTVSETGYLQQVGAGAGDLVGNTSVAQWIVRPLADLAVTKIATPASLRLGAGNLTYTLTVTNNGPSDASGVQVEDILPSGLTWVSSTPSQGTCSGTASISCALGSLARGASATVAIVVTPNSENTYINTATVSATTTDLKPANNQASVSTVVGNPVVYAVIAIDTEADNNHPMGTYNTPFEVYNYQRNWTTCSGFTSIYAAVVPTWTAYADGTVFNFTATPNGGTTPSTSYTCGTNNAYGLDDYARAVRFTVPSDGFYDVSVQLSVTGSPPDTNLYVVPESAGVPNLAAPLSTYTAHAGGFTSGSYVTIGSNLALSAGQNYWWVAARQASGDDFNQFAVYRGSPTSSNTFTRIMDSTFRNATRDSANHSFKMTWYMEMDEFINQGLYTDGREMDYLTLYKELMANWGAEVTSYGDEIAYHHHFMTWNGSSWVQGGQEQAYTGPYDAHNNALDHMVLDAGFFPTNFRAGWLNNDNQLQAWLEQWMLSDDGGAGWAGAGWVPYHPSATNYTAVDTTGEVAHWLANCPGGPSQTDVNAAFAQAIAQNRPVFYCIYFHERDDMHGAVANLHTYLTTAAAANPGVPFYYATAREAMQAIIHTTDTTPPVLTISPTSSDNYTIFSNEPLWGEGPYVAARYGEGAGAIYQHLTATPSGANTWTIAIPGTNGSLFLEEVGAGANDRYGNPSVATLANPTSVTISDFQAAPSGDGVTIRWQTASEIGLTGFNLYRSASPSGAKTHLDFIPAQHPGQMLPSSYEYRDPILPGQTWYYWLEVVGTGEWLGPLGPLTPLPPLPYKVMLPLLTR